MFNKQDKWWFKFDPDDSGQGGIYDFPIEDGIEISSEKAEELFAGFEKGKVCWQHPETKELLLRSREAKLQDDGTWKEPLTTRIKSWLAGK